MTSWTAPPTLLVTVGLALGVPAQAAAPIAPTIAAQQLTEGVTGSFSVPAFSDPDGDTLSYAYAGLPSWLTVYNPTVNPRYLLGTPPYTESGSSTNKTYWITVTASDPAGERASKAFSLTVLNANGPPARPDGIPAQTAYEDAYFSYTIPAFADPDGDAVSYSFVGLPARLAVYNPASNPRYLYGRPPATESGPTVNKIYWITATASDAFGHSASRAFQLTVQNVNRPPIAPVIADQIAVEQQQFSLAVPRFMDPDYDTLDYAFDGLPHWLSVYNPASNPRFLNGRAPALGANAFRRKLGPITAVARDPSGAVAQQSFGVAITRLMRLPGASRASLEDEVTRPSVFIDPDWYIWCQSPVKGPDGRYHLFYSR